MKKQHNKNMHTLAPAILDASIICSCFFCAGDGPSSLKEEEDKVRVVGLIPLIVLCVGDDIMKAFKLPIIEKIRANHAGYRYII